MHKILIVDDERPARDYIAELVAACISDAKVVKVDSAENALTCLRKDDFDLLFIDIEMPGMTGLQLLEYLSTHSDKGGRLPYTFIITAFRKYEYALKGFRLGILDYIEKPLHYEKIHNAIKFYLDSIETGTIELKVFEGFSRIQINRLVAILTIGRNKVTIYTSDTVLPVVYQSLKDLYELLPSNFRYIKRNCIINVREVKRYNPKSREIYIVSQNREYAFEVSRENMKEIVATLNNSVINNEEK